MQPYIAVYCTDCKNFSINNKEEPSCEYKDICELRHPEDSQPFMGRPMYEPIMKQCVMEVI